MAETAALIARGQAGERAAVELLLARYRPRLEAYVHSRVPAGARGVADTQDVVQEVLLAASERLGSFQDRGMGAFWVFLRQSARHRLVDLWRSHRRDAARAPLPDDSREHPAAALPGPLSGAVDAETRERFESALERVSERARRAVVLRLELEAGYAEIAHDCGFPTEDAARMSVRRALKEIAEEMARGGTT
jgi:RNA polymerase sigma-70 factor (ECF subfamily)